MTRKPRHPAISEEDLLDLVEGRLPLERIQELEPHLRADPDLAALVKAMSHDRAHLRTMANGSYSAPPGLIEGAMAQAEREALMDDSPATRAAAASGAALMPKLIAGLAAGVAITLTVAFAANFVLNGEDKPQEIERFAVEPRVAEPYDSNMPIARPPENDPEFEGELRSALVQDFALSQEETFVDEPFEKPLELTIRTVLSERALDRAERLARDNRLRVVIYSSDEPISLASLGELQGLRARDGRMVIKPFDLAMFGMPEANTTEPIQTEHAIYANELAPGTYTAEAELTGSSGVRSILKTLENDGHELRIEQAARPRRPRTRPDDVLWWTPSTVEVPAVRALIEFVVRDDH